MNAAQRSFGRRLRDHREHSQITLGEIAAATKIKRALLEDLERGELSTWPGGIFRRAFVRGYATAIGLPPEPVIEEFVQLFPEAGTADRVDTPKNELRLTLAVDPWRDIVTKATRAIVAVVEAGLIVAAARLIASILVMSPWSGCAVIALAYYALGAACVGRSPASWYLQNGRVPWHRRSNSRSPSRHTRDLIHLVQRRERCDDQIHEDPASPASRPPLRVASR